MKKALASVVTSMLALCCTCAIAHASSGQTHTTQHITYTLHADKTATITAYDGPGGEVTLSEEVAGPDGMVYTVSVIGPGAFTGQPALTDITIPDSITSIGEHAFDGCENLADITLPKGLLSIEAGLFAGCGSLVYVPIPNRVTEIGDGAFSECTGLASVLIPDSVATIGSRVFDGCENLLLLKIPQDVASIQPSAFDGWDGTLAVTDGSYAHEFAESHQVAYRFRIFCS